MMEIQSKKLLQASGGKKLSRKLFVQTAKGDSIRDRDPQWAYISEDGVKWVLTNCPGLDSRVTAYSGIRYWAEKGVWYRTYDNTNRPLVYSFDGIHWQSKSFSNAVYYFRDGGGKLLVFPEEGSASTLYYTSDMVNWGTMNFPFSNQYALISTPDYGNGLWCVTDTGPNSATNYIHKSSNGTTWSNVSFTSGYLNGAHILYAKNRFYAFRRNVSPNRFYWSTDCSSWNALSVDSSVFIRNVVEANGVVFVFTRNNIFYSTDGVNFVQSTVGGETPKYGFQPIAICYANGVYIAFDKYATVYVSTNLATWNAYNFNCTSFSLNSVDDLFVCTMYETVDGESFNLIKTSNDGVHWKNRLTAPKALGPVDIL